MPHTLSPSSKTQISLEDKVWALKAKERSTAREVVFSVYKKNNKDTPNPKFVATTFWQWKKTIEKHLREDDPKAITLCKKYGIEIAEVKDEGNVRTE
jgi:uridylate kinase